MGVPPAVVARMTWHDAMDVFNYWSEFPPPHELMKAGFGIETKKDKPKQKFTPSKEDLINMMNQINRR